MRASPAPNPRCAAQWVRRIGIAVGLGGLTACAPLSLSRSAATSGDALAQGRAEYAAVCASCHGAEGRGDGPQAASLQAPLPDLTGLSERNGGKFPREYVRAVITGEYALAAHGSRDMPVWGVRFDHAAEGGPAVATLYAERRLGRLIAYLESIQVRE